MGGVKDLMMDNMDLIPEDTELQEVKELCNKTYELLDGLKVEMDKLVKTLTQDKLVNKNYGRHKCKIFYDDKEITDEELRYLRRSLTPAQILKDFKYINEYNELIIPTVSPEYKQLCRNMIANRTR